MAREKRIQTPGYYYITTHSVDYRNIFIQNRDYSKFLSLLRALSLKYNFQVHCYTILVSSYHILIETSEKNLSTIVKFLNSNYSKYFNKTYNREGTLWRARYESFYILEIEYLPYFFKYIISIPQLVGATTKLHLYYHSSYRQFIGADKRLPLLEDSIIFNNFNRINEVEKFFSEQVTKDRIEHICYILKEKRKNGNISLQSFFSENQTKKELHHNIVRAYQHGFSQKEIAIQLNVTQQAIQKKLKKSS